MTAIEIPAKNAVNITISLQVENPDGTKTPYPDMGTALDIVVVLRDTKTRSKELEILQSGSPGSFSIDDPVTGDLKLILTSAQTDIPAGLYDIGVQVRQATLGLNDQEWPDKKRVRITQDNVV